MLKGQAQEGSEIGRKYVCSVRAFGGFKIDSLSCKLNSVKTCVHGYYHAGVVLVGTNDIISDDFDIWTFMRKLKELLLRFHSQIKSEHVIVLGFFPRSFCKRKNCNTNECMYIHKGYCKMHPIQYNSRILNVNKGVEEFIKFDMRFRSFKYANFFQKVVKLGSIDNSYKNFLSYDGLHLSDNGNVILDEWLTKFLNDMEW